MWYVTAYQPVGLISLKIATATSTGGKSLLLPTPFAFKMALLDVAIRAVGVANAIDLWPYICNAAVAVDGPERIVANNTFIKIMKPTKNKPKPDVDTGLIPPMNRSIGFREYVQWHGDCRIAIELEDVSDAQWGNWLTNIQYIGKRGGFIQALGAPEYASELDSTFTLLTQQRTGFSLDGTLQIMDDCGDDTPFERVDVYSGVGMRVGKERVLRHIVIPYRMERSSRGYTLYHRID